jgi:hypothetical protein
MRKSLFTLVAIAFFAMASNAQDYQGGVGFRLSGFNSNGLTGKFFISRDKALEGIIAGRFGGIHIAGLYEIHAPIPNAPGLFWFYGPGAFIATIDGYKKNPWWHDGVHHSVIGVTGIIGIEYSIGQIPFTVGMDYKPAFSLLGGFGFWGDEVAFSIRYVW